MNVINRTLLTAGIFLAAGTVVTTAAFAQNWNQAPQNGYRPGGQLPGIDVAISAIAASTGGGKAINIYATAASSASLPAAQFALTASTTSCNFQPNDSGTRNYATGELTGWVPAEWYAAWDSDLPGINFANPLEIGTHPNTPTWLWGARHPYIVTNVYRLNAEGRLEQLAASWIKHGWLAASVSQSEVAGPNGQPRCGTGTCSGLGNNFLGANCSDTYGAGLNADRRWLGPRTEVRANAPFHDPGWAIPDSWLAKYDYAGDVDALQGGDGYSRAYNSSGTGQSWKLCQVKLSELDTSPQGLGPPSGFGRVFIEGYYVVNGDNYKFNNFASRRFTYTQPSGSISAANFTFDGPHTYGPTLLQWGSMPGLNVPGTFRHSVAQPTNEGTIYVASRVVDLGGGQWRYEYNVLNADFDREVMSVRVNVPLSATVTNQGFWQPRQASPGYHGFNRADPQQTAAGGIPLASSNWSYVYDVDNKAGMWAAPAPIPSTVRPNTIRWGTMYTFWFTANYPPSHNGSMTLTARIPGTASEFVASGISVPKNPADIAGTDGSPGADGNVDNGDFGLFISAFFAGCSNPGSIPCSPADIASTDNSAVPDGNLDNGDFGLFITAFFGG
jgi:hypothetical protein